MRLYVKVKHLLIEFPELRSSDKMLIWKIWLDGGFVKYDTIRLDAFMQAPSVETIRRTRQKVQEYYPELQATEGVRRAKKLKQSTKGTFVYGETFTGKLF
jgi:hypothetical protein